MKQFIYKAFIPAGLRPGASAKTRMTYYVRVVFYVVGTQVLISKLIDRTRKQAMEILRLQTVDSKAHRFGGWDLDDTLGPDEMTLPEENQRTTMRGGTPSPWWATNSPIPPQKNKTPDLATRCYVCDEFLFEDPDLRPIITRAGSWCSVECAKQGNHSPQKNTSLTGPCAFCGEGWDRYYPAYMSNNKFYCGIGCAQDATRQVERAEQFASDLVNDTLTFADEDEAF